MESGNKKEHTEASFAPLTYRIVNETSAEAWLRQHTRYKQGAFLFAKDIRELHDINNAQMRYYHIAISKIYKGKAVNGVINKYRGWYNVEVVWVLSSWFDWLQMIDTANGKTKQAPKSKSEESVSSEPHESSELDPQEAAEEWLRNNVQLQHGKFLPSRRIMALRKCTKYDMRYMHPAMQKVFSGLAIMCMRKLMRGWLHVEVL